MTARFDNLLVYNTFKICCDRWTKYWMIFWLNIMFQRQLKRDRETIRKTLTLKCLFLPVNLLYLEASSNLKNTTWQTKIKSQVQIIFNQISVWHRISSIYIGKESWLECLILWTAQIWLTHYHSIKMIKALSKETKGLIDSPLFVINCNLTKLCSIWVNTELKYQLQDRCRSIDAIKAFGLIYLIGVNNLNKIIWDKSSLNKNAKSQDRCTLID